MGHHGLVSYFFGQDGNWLQEKASERLREGKVGSKTSLKGKLIECVSRCDH